MRVMKPDEVPSEPKTHVVGETILPGVAPRDGSCRTQRHIVPSEEAEGRLCHSDHEVGTAWIARVKDTLPGAVDVANIDVDVAIDAH